MYSFNEVEIWYNINLQNTKKTNFNLHKINQHFPLHLLYYKLFFSSCLNVQYKHQFIERIYASLKSTYSHISISHCISMKINNWIKTCQIHKSQKSFTSFFDWITMFYLIVKYYLFHKPYYHQYVCSCVFYGDCVWFIEVEVSSVKSAFYQLFHFFMYHTIQKCFLLLKVKIKRIFLNQ